MWWEELFSSFWAHFLSNLDVSYIIRNGTMSPIRIWKHFREILKSDGERPKVLNLCSVTALRLERSTPALLNAKGTSDSKWFSQQGLEDECRTSVACLIAVTLCTYKCYNSAIANWKTQVYIAVSDFLKNATDYLSIPQALPAVPGASSAIWNTWSFLELSGTNSGQVGLSGALWR